MASCIDRREVLNGSVDANWRSALDGAFFTGSLALRRAEDPPPLEIETGIDVFDRIGHLPAVEPAGVIVHMTRCGSTLVLNALRGGEDVVGVSEAPSIDRALGMTVAGCRYTVGVAERLLPALVSVFSGYQGTGPKKVIIKCGAAGTLALAAIRRIWPEVPCLILVRNPLEIMVSNLDRLPRWIRAIKAGDAPHPLSEPPSAVMSEPAALLAWVLGQFHAGAMRGLDSKTFVMDYEDISPTGVLRIAALFGVRFSEDGPRRLADLFALDAKAPRKRFEPDGERKREKASDSQRRHAETWVNDLYWGLKKHQSIGLNAAQP